MEEEKAAAYYDELTRKGEGAARFKQGLGFSSASSYASSADDVVPARGSGLPSSSSFLSSFVRASSPFKESELQKQAQVLSIQNKLRKKSAISSDNDRYPSSRVSEGSARDGDRDRRSRMRNRSGSLRRSRSRSRSRSKGRRDDHKSRPHGRGRERSRSRDRGENIDRDRERERERRKTRRSRSRSISGEGRGRVGRRRSRSLSPQIRGSDKSIGNGKKVRDRRKGGVDYAKLIDGYEKMSPAERVKAKMKFQLSETAEKDAEGMGSGWERFDFDKDAPLDDEEIEGTDDDAGVVKHVGQSFRLSAVEARREEKIKAAHDEAIFGTLSRPPSIETDSEADGEIDKKETTESAPVVASLISDQVRTMQVGSWRDRARRL